MEKFTDRVIGIIKGIPPGKVMTYGQIARMAGSPRGARQVVRILHSMGDKYGLPWHRVINVRGQIGFKDDEHFLTQKMALEHEGVVFSAEDTVDLKVYLYDPGMELSDY